MVSNMEKIDQTLPNQPAGTQSVDGGERRVVMEARNVCKAYEERPVLRSIDLVLRAGERLALCGPSGSGKTTLLNCLGGVDRVDSGSLILEGTPMQSLSSEDLALLRRRRIGTIFQFFHLLPTLTAAENVELPLQLLGISSAERAQRVDEMLQKVNVAHRADALPGQLSGGEMQRVAVARALIHRPGLILADEPTGNLDSVNGDRVLSLLQALSEESQTALVLVTHSEDATRICHRKVHLKDGSIVGLETT